jgi:tetratricopeptide (TPR) repeat protein
MVVFILVPLLIAPFSRKSCSQSPPRQPATREARNAFPEVSRLIDSNRLGEARSNIKELVQLGEENYKTLYYEALILFKESRHPESLKTLERAFTTQKYDPDLYFLAGLNWVALNQLRLARPFFLAATQLAPEDEQLRYHMGRLDYTDQQFAAAEKSFRRALEINPSFVKAHDNLGLALEALGKEEQAIESYQRAIELVDQQKLKYEWPFVNLGRFLFKKNRFNESLNLARRATVVNEGSSEAFYLLAENLNKGGKLPEAKEALKVAIKNNPEYSKPHYLLGQILRRQGLQEEARKELQVFQELDQKEKEKERRGGGS